MSNCVAGYARFLNQRKTTATSWVNITTTKKSGHNVVRIGSWQEMRRLIPIVSGLGGMELVCFRCLFCTISTLNFPVDARWLGTTGVWTHWLKSLHSCAHIWQSQCVETRDGVVLTSSRRLFHGGLWRHSSSDVSAEQLPATNSQGYKKLPPALQYPNYTLSGTDSWFKSNRTHVGREQKTT